MKIPLTSLLFSTLLSSALLGQEPDPSSLRLTKWTPHFQVPDPVAISFDHQGRAYVTQTQRRKANDLDIRQNRDWITTDLSFQSPDDKRAFYQRIFTPENSAANQERVEDYNQDGSHDLLDLQFLSERIHLIEDTDGDGLADKTSIYAADFNDEIAGIAAGVLHHDGHVYTTIVPDLWKLSDTDNDGKADTRQSIATGFGVHLAYAGHDMHGLTLGPDGRIYWTVGDKGLSVKSKEGHHFKYPNQGAVLRCDPDGSNFEVYARGLRNVQELAFDQHGNLFGIDNDSDRPGEKERFIYIVQHMDAGWRSNWQYRTSRNGKDDFNPWMDENLSIPYHEGQPAHILPPISLTENGPAGLAYNPGTALSADWQNYFFHTSAPNGQQWAFQVEQNGASYKMVNHLQIGNGIPLVGINFGPDGALYGVDWGGGYPLNQQGAVWKWDVEKKHPLREQTATILRASSAVFDNRDLIAHLNHPDQRVRLKAQFELAKRDSKISLYKAAQNGPQLSRIHAIWALAQKMRTSISEPHKFLALLDDPDPEIRAQVIKCYGDTSTSNLALHNAPVAINNPFEYPRIEKHLKDESDRVKFQAAVALGNLWPINSHNESASHALLDFAQTIRPEQTYLRHAAIVGLTGCASSEFLAALADDKSELIQKIAIVALRRRADPAVAAFLSSPFENVATDAARAIHDDWTIPEAMPALAASLADTQWLKNESLIRRAINANFHLGTPEHAKRVALFSTKKDSTVSLRLGALDALSNWTNPAPLDRVVGRHRPLLPRHPAIATSAITAQLATLLTDPVQEIQTRAMSLARALEIKIPTQSLVLIAKNKTSPAELRIESLRSLASQKHPQLDSILNTALIAENDQVRIAALQLLANTNAQAALIAIEKTLQQDTASTHEKQVALKLLSLTLESKKGDQLLQSLLANLDSIPASLRLDLLEAAAIRKLKAPAPDFSHTLTGGDALKGKDLFTQHLAAQCIRCHKVAKGKGSDIGPNLKSIGLKDRAHLLESIIAPQKIIADGYGAISVTLKNGKAIAGTFKQERKGHLEIRPPDGKLIRVKLADIKDRSPIISTMPPMGDILTKREVRDIIQYLTTLKAK